MLFLPRCYFPLNTPKRIITDFIILMARLWTGNANQKIWNQYLCPCTIAPVSCLRLEHPQFNYFHHQFKQRGFGYGADQWGEGSLASELQIGTDRQRRARAAQFPLRAKQSLAAPALILFFLSALLMPLPSTNDRGTDGSKVNNSLCPSAALFPPAFIISSRLLSPHSSRALLHVVSMWASECHSQAITAPWLLYVHLLAGLKTHRGALKNTQTMYKKCRVWFNNPTS